MGNEDTLAKDLVLGKTGKGETVTVDIVLRAVGRNMQSAVDHRDMSHGVELSIMGTVYDDGVSVDTLRAGTGSARHLDNHTLSGGQISHYLSDIVEPYGMSGQDVKRLQEIWDKYHLNAMKAGCAHQQKLPEGKTGVWGLDNIKPCPETGYKYGSAWLYEELPTGLIPELKQIIAKVTK